MELTEEQRQKRRESGRLGGLAKVSKGFATNRELAREAGAKGRISRKRKAKEAVASNHVDTI